MAALEMIKISRLSGLIYPLLAGSHQLDPAIAGKNSVDLNSYPSDLIRQPAKQRLTGSIDAMLRMAQE